MDVRGFHPFDRAPSIFFFFVRVVEKNRIIPCRLCVVMAARNDEKETKKLKVSSWRTVDSAVVHEIAHFGLNQSRELAIFLGLKNGRCSLLLW